MTQKTVDVIVVGAGLAGLICAKELQDAGHSVLVLDKSRGVGGRVATKRLHNTCVDQGLPTFEPQGEYTEGILHSLSSLPLLQRWTDLTYQQQPDGRCIPLESGPQYTVSEGINAIAKFLAQDLPLHRQQRAEKLTLQNNHWQITCNLDQTPTQYAARAVVVAIPTPQAIALLGSFADLFPDLQRVEFDPCFSLMAGYSPSPQWESLPWNLLTLPENPSLQKIIYDSRKRPHPEQPVFVLHSTPHFASPYLDHADPESVASLLLDEASQTLNLPFHSPQWLQVHRWRYARPRTFLGRPCLWTSHPLPLLCCGDWCLGNTTEAALCSGKSAGQTLNTFLSHGGVG